MMSATKHSKASLRWRVHLCDRLISSGLPTLVAPTISLTSSIVLSPDDILHARKYILRALVRKALMIYLRVKHLVELWNRLADRSKRNEYIVNVAQLLLPMEKVLPVWEPRFCFKGGTPPPFISTDRLWAKRCYPHCKRFLTEANFAPEWWYDYCMVCHWRQVTVGSFP